MSLIYSLQMHQETERQKRDRQWGQLEALAANRSASRVGNSLTSRYLHQQTVGGKGL